MIAGNFSITVHLRDSNLAPRFRAVDHAESNDNDDFEGVKTILTDYCQYPVPEEYELKKLTYTVSSISFGNTFLNP